MAESPQVSSPSLLIPVLVLVLSVGACAAIPPETAPPMAGAGCNADAVRWVVGRAPEASVVERARVESGSATVRVITPDTAVTTDYSPVRLNLNVNARGAIDAVKCG